MPPPPPSPSAALPAVSPARLIAAVRRHAMPVLLSAVLVVLLLWPVVMLACGAFRDASPLSGEGGWSTAAWGRIWAEANRGGALAHSVILSVSVTLPAVGLACLLASVATRTDAGIRRLVTPLNVVALAISPLFYAIGYDLLGNRFTGLASTGFQQLTGGTGQIVDIESWFGLILVEILIASSHLYFFLLGPFRALDRAHEEASMAAGAGRLRTLLRIDLPLLTPIVAGVLVIGLVSGLQSFDSALILGEPAGISFLPVQLYRLLTDHNPPLYADAAAIALCLVVLVLLLARAQTAVQGRRSYVSVSGRSYRQEAWPLGLAGRITATVLVVVYALLAVVLPLSAIVFSSFQPFPGVYQNLNTHAYTALFSNPALTEALRNSALLSVLGGLAAMVLALAAALGAARAGRRTAAALRALTLLPLGLPGVIGSLALIWAYTTLPGLRGLYGTVWMMLVALVVAVLPVAVQIASAAVTQMSRDLPDASRVAGAGPLRTAFHVTGRLLLPSLCSGWCLAGVLILGNLDAPLLLGGADLRTVSTLSYELFASSQQSQAAALLSMVIAVVAAGAALWALSSALRRRWAARPLPSVTVPAARPSLARSAR